ncbi:MAG: type IX secretion system membrane protein PorP/SprF [Bacteroidota bacterium]|nr:type IX secretion system membrane protein PorP/SprF [Bacteroidota bacterium]
MKNVFSFLFFLIILNLAAIAQQDPQFSQNMFNQASVNPGYVGSGDNANLLLLSRYQWVGFAGSPRTNVFNVDAPVNLFGVTSGVGLTVMSDKIGFESDVLVNLIYAYQKKTANGNLGIGFSLGFFNYGLNPQWVYPEDGNVSVDQDNSIPTNGKKSSQVATDLGLGLFYQSSQFYVGASAKHLNRPSLTFENLSSYFIERNYYLTSGYNFQLPIPGFELRPSMFIKSDGASYQVDLNTNLVYEDRLWGGLSYRIDDGFVILLGAEMLSGLKVGYAFDVTTSAIAKGGFGSHEFFVGYSFKLQKNKNNSNNKYKSVRFL